MANKVSDTQPVQVEAQPVPVEQVATALGVQPAPFNPFTLLSVDETNNELLALGGRFNKSWKAQRNERITAIAVEYNCSTAEACFAVWLQDDARAILSRERIKNVADSILEMLPEVMGKDEKLALMRIEAKYQSVPVIDRPDVGRKVREAAYKSYTGKVAGIMLEALYGYLDVKESDWKAL